MIPAAAGPEASCLPGFPAAAANRASFRRTHAAKPSKLTGPRSALPLHRHHPRAQSLCAKRGSVRRPHASVQRDFSVPKRGLPPTSESFSIPKLYAQVKLAHFAQRAVTDYGGAGRCAIAMPSICTGASWRLAILGRPGASNRHRLLLLPECLACGHHPLVEWTAGKRLGGSTVTATM